MEYNIKEATIEKIYKSTNRKDGTPYITKPSQYHPKGRPFTKVDIYIDSSAVDDMGFNGRMSMVDFDGLAQSWEEGTKISGVVKQNGDFWNFEIPKQSKVDISNLVTKEEFNELEGRVELLENNSRGRVEPNGQSEDELPF